MHLVQAMHICHACVLRAALGLKAVECDYTECARLQVHQVLQIMQAEGLSFVAEPALASWHGGPSLPNPDW